MSKIFTKTETDALIDAIPVAVMEDSYGDSLALTTGPDGDEIGHVSYTALAHHYCIDASDYGIEQCSCCSATLDDYECGDGEYRARYVDADGAVSDDVALVCQDCLDAGDPSGPGYRQVEVAS